MDRNEEIRMIAYSIWEQDGCCYGHEIEHWLKAEIIWQTKNIQTDKVESASGSNRAVKVSKKDKSSKAGARKPDKRY